MKEKSSFTAKDQMDYTQSKDAYDGNRESSSYQDYPSLDKKISEKSKSPDR